MNVTAYECFKLILCLFNKYLNFSEFFLICPNLFLGQKGRFV